MMSYGLVIYFGLTQYRKKRRLTHAAAEAAALSDSGNINSSGGGPGGIGSGMLVSRSWMYGRTQIEQGVSTANRSRTSGGNDGSGEESTSLLESHRRDIDQDKDNDRNKGKNKGEAVRLYQTAVEYRGDTTEYYPLPRAPASAVLLED